MNSIECAIEKEIWDFHESSLLCKKQTFIGRIFLLLSSSSSRKLFRHERFSSPLGWKSFELQQQQQIPLSAPWERQRERRNINRTELERDECARVHVIFLSCIYRVLLLLPKLVTSPVRSYVCRFVLKIHTDTTDELYFLFVAMAHILSRTCRWGECWVLNEESNCKHLSAIDWGGGRDQAARPRSLSRLSHRKIEFLIKYINSLRAAFSQFT